LLAYLHSVYRELRADPFTHTAIHTVHLLPQLHPGVMVSLTVQGLRYLQNILRTVLPTVCALFAPLGDYVYSPQRFGKRGFVDGLPDDLLRDQSLRVSSSNPARHLFLADRSSRRANTLRICPFRGERAYLTKTCFRKRQLMTPLRTPSLKAPLIVSLGDPGRVTMTKGAHSRIVTLPRLSLRNSEHSSDPMSACLSDLTLDAKFTPTAYPMLLAIEVLSMSSNL